MINPRVSLSHYIRDIFFLLPVIFILLFFQNGWGQVTLPHLDAINYTVSQGLQTQTNWTSLNSGDDLLIASGNLSYTGLETSSGNKVTFDAAGIDAAKLFTQQTSGTVYYSFLLNVTALGSLNATGGYFTGFTEGATSTFGSTVWSRLDGVGYDIGINPRTTAANTVWSTGTTSINTTLFIVISYQIVGGATNDVVNLWINPTPGIAEPAATLTATNTLTDLANINRILIRQDGTAATPFIEMDELRIGTTWASVTPASSNSTSSDIITANNETPNIDYASKTAASITATSDAIRVWSFNIRDGGGAADGDAVGTILTAVTIDKGGSNGVTNWANTVKQAALYDGATEVAEITVTGETMVFSSISVTAADGGNKTLDLYLTFETTNITDNEQFQFRIQKANTTTDAAGSSFTSFTDVISSVTGDNNRIEVTATKLNFIQQPSNTQINVAMSPAVTVEAADANNNRDLDFTSNIRITSTGTLTGTPVDVAASSGLATFSTLTHTATGTGFTLNAEKTSDGLWDVTSSAFDIVNIYTTLLDNYDGIADLTYTTEGTWVVSGSPFDDYESRTDGLTDPEHSYASYDLVNAFPDWELNNSRENSWCGWMDLNRPSVGGWGASSYSCAMVLAANGSDFNASTTSGIAIGFRDDDVLVLFRFSAGVVSGASPLPLGSTLMVATTYTYSDTDNGVNFFVEYLSDGTWKVYWKIGVQLSDPNAVVKGNYTDGNVTSGVDNTYTGTSYSYAGWAHAHSSGIGDKTFFDNFSAGISPLSTTISTSAISGSPFCITASTGAAVSVDFTSTGTFAATNDYTAQLSDASGSFGSPANIGSLTDDNSNSGTISATIPAGTASGTGYRIRVIANDPATTGTNNGADLIIVLGPENVSGISSIAGNTQAAISWTNSATCFDQILVVGKATTSVTATPTGDGTLYTANSIFGTGGSGANLPANEYAVYKNTGTSITVTGLTNGTQYCFKIFTRKGTTWSSGVEVCVTPAVITTLGGGDLAILGIDANHAGACGGGAADDEISFVCFKDIVTGTTLDFTDNGWQRTTANKWGNTEGTIRMTRTGGTILAGVVMTLKIDESVADAASGRYSIIMPADAGWSFSEINFAADFNMNSGGDQIYFMQGGTWNSGVSGNHDATYTGGAVLFGFSTTGSWIDFGASTQKSGLYPLQDCYSMSPTSATDFNKYTGDLSPATQREWIGRINDPANWDSYTRCQDYVAAAPDYAGGCCTLTILAGGFASGKWLGSVSNDWFDCDNWESLQIPDASTDVTLPAAGVTFDPLIAVAGALSNNLANESPRILTINGTGTLTISGNLTNNATITHTAGTVTFNGTSAQSIGGTSTTTFYNLTLNNISTGLTLNSPVNINNALLLTDGVLFTDATNILTLQDNATSSSGSASSFVDGPLKKIGDEAFVFPMGDGTRWARIGISAHSLTTTQYTAQYFANDPTSNGYTSTSLAVGPPTLNNVSTKEYWKLDQAINNDDVQVTLYWENASFSGIDDCDGTPDDLRISHWNSTNSNWEINVDAVVLTGTCGTSGIVRTNTNQPDYSPFTFGSKGSGQNPLPVEWLDFTGKFNGKNVELHWETATEINNDFFTIELGINLQGFENSEGLEWKNIGTVKGAGNSSSVKNYKFIDKFPSERAGENRIYYRLKQTDYDGKYSYSKIISVKILSGGFIPDNFYVNNDEKTISFFINDELEGSVMVEITDVSGRIVFRKNISKNETQINFDCKSFSEGMYFFVVANEEKTFVKKFIFY